MMSSVIDIAFELVNYFAWALTALGAGDPLYNLGSAF